MTEHLHFMQLLQNYKPWEEESQKKTSGNRFNLHHQLRRFIGVLYSLSRLETSRVVRVTFLIRVCP